MTTFSDEMESLLPAMTEWQKRMLQSIFDNNACVVMTARLNGRHIVSRMMILSEVMAQGHVDVLDSKGHWCVTRSGIGPLLWVRTRP